MAKGNGMFSNFSGKVGTIVGYTNKQSNNKQTQVVRSYQPVVRNPMTLAQATQRVKFAPVFWTYRKLKAIIDRGQEGVEYGNRSRFAWLKQALSEYTAPWYQKDAIVQLPCLCPITIGSLGSLAPRACGVSHVSLPFRLPENMSYGTIGHISEAILPLNPNLQLGDQITIVTGDAERLYVLSFVIDPGDTTAIAGFSDYQHYLFYNHQQNLQPATNFSLLIQSRKASDGRHLRSTSSVFLPSTTAEQSPYQEASRLPAVESYMSSASNSDWPEEQL